MPAAQACHTCRRQRLKCDRSLPQCLKCIQRGQECLGYQRLLRWMQGVASRGKMAGKTFADTSEGPAQSRMAPPERTDMQGDDSVTLPRTLTDPLLQDVNQTSRKYLHYFASDVCRDLVLYDTPKHNPFRELIPMTQSHPVLLHIIVADSALHMSNACQKSFGLDSISLSTHRRKSLLGSTFLDRPAVHPSHSYKDALTAKQQALSSLQTALANVASLDIDVTLAVILLFIEFELIDSGRDHWKPHIHGARTIIDRLCGADVSPQAPLSPLRSCLISNCLVFDILGSSLSSSMRLVPSDTVSTGALSLLLDDEGNHCSSFPISLLRLIRVGAQLLHSDQSSSPDSLLSEIKMKQATTLLDSAQSFNPHLWATNIQQRSPVMDVQNRMLIATAHRAAVCIYLSRVLLSLDPYTHLPYDLESLVTEVVTHASFIRPSDPLFTAITWPAFIAGAETRDSARQKWVNRKFEELWEVEPWGLMRGALEVLSKLWIKKNDEARDPAKGGAWIEELRVMGVDWLII